VFFLGKERFLNASVLRKGLNFQAEKKLSSIARREILKVALFIWKKRIRPFRELKNKISILKRL